MTLLTYEPPLSPYLDILYQDDDIVVACKPAGLLSVPGKQPQHFDSLSSRLQRVWPGIRVVHRLDMATSGLLVFALHKTAQAALQRQFERRQVTKEYIALVWGPLPAMAGSIDLPMRCDWPNRPRQMLDFVEGKAATTHYRQLPHQKPTSPPITRVALIPHTGRSHQLRVHMQALNSPILGDKFYAHDHAFAAAERLCLHAERLAFLHPVSQQQLSFHRPADF